MSDKASDAYLKNLPLDVLRAIQGIKGLDALHDGIRREYLKEVQALDNKYAAQYQLLYERRKQVIAGKVGVTQDEIDVGESLTSKDDNSYQKLSRLYQDRMANPVRVDAFWFRVLQCYPDLSYKIAKTDEDALGYLTDITITYPNASKNNRQALGTSTAFTVNFHFSPNKYFTNTILSKTYIYKADIDFWGNFLYERVIGDKISWKLNQDLIKLAKTPKVPVRNRGNNGDSEDDDDDDDDEPESFFEFFNPPALATRSGPLANQDEEDEREDLLGDEFMIGEALKERIIPRAVDYFTHKASEYEDDDDSDFDDDEDDDEEDDDD